MVDKAVLDGFRSLDSWQMRVLGVKGPIEETYYKPSFRGSDTSLKRGALILVIELNGGWYLSYMCGGESFYLMGNTIDSGTVAPSRTFVEVGLYLSIGRGHIPRVLPKLDMYRKVRGYLDRHPEVVMSWAVSEELLFRTAALGVLNG